MSLLTLERKLRKQYRKTLRELAPIQCIGRGHVPEEGPVIQHYVLKGETLYRISHRTCCVRCDKTLSEVWVPTAARPRQVGGRAAASPLPEPRLMRHRRRTNHKVFDYA